MHLTAELESYEDGSRTAVLCQAEGNTIGRCRSGREVNKRH